MATYIKKGRAESESLAAQKTDAARLKFLATANHDLRQPLHAMSLFVSALNERARANPDQPISEFIGLLDKIGRSQKTVEELLENLLDFSKLDSGMMKTSPQVFQLGTLLDRLQERVAAVAQGSGISFSVVSSSVQINSDQLLIERLLNCLVMNAIKFTEEGKILVGARHEQGRVRIEVWDTGVGVSEDQVENVFEPFVQLTSSEFSANQGLGLGLAIVEGIARLLQAELEVRSWPGQGSCFSISLPIVDKEKLDQTQGSPKKTDQEVSTILCIDDDPTVLDAMEILVEGWGYNIIAADSLAAAQEKLAASEQKPCLLIVDYRLGDTGNGIEALVALRETLGQSAVAALVTGDTDTSLMEEAKKCGAILLHKPIKPAQLHQLIRSVVAGVCG